MWRTISVPPKLHVRVAFVLHRPLLLEVDKSKSDLVRLTLSVDQFRLSLDSLKRYLRSNQPIPSFRKQHQPLTHRFEDHLVPLFGSSSLAMLRRKSNLFPLPRCSCVQGLIDYKFTPSPIKLSVFLFVIITLVSGVRQTSQWQLLADQA